MQNAISGVVLAGGTAKRFGGKTKPKIEINGKPVLSIITNILSNIFSEIIIVTNTPEEYVDYYQYKITGDLFHGKGPLGGIHAGLKACTGEGAFVVAADMPLISSEFIIKQIEYFKQNNFDIVIPRNADNIEPLHSVYSTTLLDKLENHLKNNENQAVRFFFQDANVGFLDVVESDNPSEIFMNINEPSDVSLVKKILEHRKDV